MKYGSIVELRSCPKGQNSSTKKFLSIQKSLTFNLKHKNSVSSAYIPNSEEEGELSGRSLQELGALMINTLSNIDNFKKELGLRRIYLIKIYIQKLKYDLFIFIHIYLLTLKSLKHFKNAKLVQRLSNFK